MHGLADRDIGGRSAGYGSPEVGGPSPPTRSTLLDSVVDVIHDMIRSYVESFHGRIETQNFRKIAVTLSSITCSRVAMARLRKLVSGYFASCYVISDNIDIFVLNSLNRNMKII